MCTGDGKNSVRLCSIGKTKTKMLGESADRYFRKFSSAGYTFCLCFNHGKLNIYGKRTSGLFQIITTLSSVIHFRIITKLDISRSVFKSTCYYLNSLKSPSSKYLPFDTGHLAEGKTEKKEQPVSLLVERGPQDRYGITVRVSVSVRGSRTHRSVYPDGN